MTNIPHLMEAALLLLVAYLIGCLIGYFLRASVFKKSSAPVAAPAAAMAKPAPTRATAVPAVPAPTKAAPSATKKPPVRKPATKTAAKSVAKPAASAPKKLDAPRNGQKDNLKTIKGIGPKIEGQLNALGVYHFDQIAEWDRATIGWVDAHLSFKGRIDREKWVPQAKTLAKSAK